MVTMVRVSIAPLRKKALSNALSRRSRSRGGRRLQLRAPRPTRTRPWLRWSMPLRRSCRRVGAGWAAASGRHRCGHRQDERKLGPRGSSWTRSNLPSDARPGLADRVTWHDGVAEVSQVPNDTCTTSLRLCPVLAQVDSGVLASGGARPGRRSGSWDVDPWVHRQTRSGDVHRPDKPHAGRRSAPHRAWEGSPWGRRAPRIRPQAGRARMQRKPALVPLRAPGYAPGDGHDARGGCSPA